MEKEINAKEAKIASLEKEANNLRQNFVDKGKEAFDYIKKQDSSFSIEDVEELLEEIEEKDSKIKALLTDKEEWENHKEELLAAQEKVVGNLEKRFSACYSSLNFSKRALKRIARLPESERIKLEQQLGFLQHNPKNANFRDDIIGTEIKELGFGNGGRVYILKEGSRFLVTCVGNKNSQNTDLKHLKSAYKTELST
jgi:chromosome segregation ATPase